MAHKHSVYDTSLHFIIDGNTRLVKNSTEAKVTLVQYDHNSERITFELPRYIDGHDMSLCTYAQVHYINIERKTNRESTGVYECDDLQIDPDNENVVICSWLISKNATKFVGSLFFVIRFICSEDREVTYSWNTARHTGLSVTDGIYNGEDVDEIVESDAFKIFEETIEAANTAVKNANKAIASANEANEIARGYLYNIQTTTDGKLQLLDADMNVITTIDTFCGDDDTLHRYADGMLSVIGIKERNKDNTYRVWVGTHEEYAALPEIDPSTFYWVNDDNTYEEFVETINTLINDHDSLVEAHNTLESDLKSGELMVKKAETASSLLLEGCSFGRRLLWSGSQVFETGQGNWYKIPFKPSEAKFLVFEFELQQYAGADVTLKFRSNPVFSDTSKVDGGLVTVSFPFPNYNETTIMRIMIKDGDGTNNNIYFILDYADYNVLWDVMKLVAIYEEF